MKNKLFLLFVIILSIILSLLLLNLNIITFGIAIFLVLSPIFLVYPHFYFLLFILIRPIFDIWAKTKIAEVNIASIFTLLLILICGTDILIKKENRYKLKTNYYMDLIVQSISSWNWCDETGKSTATYYRYKKKFQEQQISVLKDNSVKEETKEEDEEVSYY